MGEEYGETAPFPYFTSHSDPTLIEAVRRGRREEFSAFEWTGGMPDPQDEATFLCAKLNHHMGSQGQHQVLTEFYRELIQLRKETPALTRLTKNDTEVIGHDRERVLVVRRWSDTDEALAIFHFGAATSSLIITVPPGRWKKQLDSTDERWQGPGSLIPIDLPPDGEVTLSLSPHAFALFTSEKET
jgi:maltooligosyltrehalose trehalohydrolase